MTHAEFQSRRCLITCGYKMKYDWSEISHLLWNDGFNWLLMRTDLKSAGIADESL